jgi:hypothetical protein
MRAVVMAVGVLLVASAAQATEWVEAARTAVEGRPLVVHARARAGSDVKEVRGVGSFDAPPWVIKNVIDDVARYEEFMPFTAQSPIVARGDGWIVSYQRLHVPFIDDRDYVVKIVDESTIDTAGRVVWKNRWFQANDLGPPPTTGVTRIDIVEGWWQLEDLDDGARTKATYYVYTSPGGSIPASLVNLGNARGVPDLFQAVAAAAREPRYRATRPTPRRPVASAPPAGSVGVANGRGQPSPLPPSPSSSSSTRPGAAP